MQAPLETNKTVAKTACDKAGELASTVVQAWIESPDVDAPLAGIGSDSFSLPAFYEGAFLEGVASNGADALRRVACASFGWTASAAGPERIFSYAGLLCDALKNRYSVEFLEVMIFLKKNAQFMPSVDEIVAEFLRRKNMAAAARSKARAASAKAAMGSASSSLEESAPVEPVVNDGMEEEDDGGGGDDGDEGFDVGVNFSASPELSEAEVEDLLSSIAEFRADFRREGEDEALLDFIRELNGVPASRHE